MQSKQGLLLAAEVLSGLDGPVKAIREATPQARHSFTVADRRCCRNLTPSPTLSPLTG